MSNPSDRDAAEGVASDGSVASDGADAVARSQNPYGAGWGKGWGASWAGIPGMDHPDQAPPEPNVEPAEPLPPERPSPEPPPAASPRTTPPMRVRQSAPPVLGDVELPSVPAEFTFPAAPATAARGGRTIRLVLVAVAAAVAGLTFWLVNRVPAPPAATAGTDATTTPATTPPVPARDARAEAQLLGMLPPGYPPGVCTPIDPPLGAIAKVNCDKNFDPDGPIGATYLLARDEAGLEAVLTAAIRRDAVVRCPGNIQSPGPWRRIAAPEQVSGTVVCGIQDGVPIVAWTDTEQMMLSAVRGGSPGSTLEQIYRWWSSHS